MTRVSHHSTTRICFNVYTTQGEDKRRRIFTNIFGEGAAATGTAVQTPEGRALVLRPVQWSIRNFPQPCECGPVKSLFEWMSAECRCRGAHEYGLHEYRGGTSRGDCCFGVKITAFCLTPICSTTTMLRVVFRATYSRCRLQSITLFLLHSSICYDRGTLCLGDRIRVTCSSSSSRFYSHGGKCVRLGTATLLFWGRHHMSVLLY